MQQTIALPLAKRQTKRSELKTKPTYLERKIRFYSVITGNRNYNFNSISNWDKLQ